MIEKKVATIFMIAYQAVGISLLYVVLRRQKRRLQDIGFSSSINVRQIGDSVGLFLAGFFLTEIFRFSVIPFLLVLPPNRPNPAVAFGTTITFFTLIFVCINAFHEELLVRAFLISEVESLYRSAGWAVLASVALQTSYHLYQGLPAALSHIPVFALFSFYYLRKRQIFPVILAHLHFDLVALAIFAYRLHR